MSKTASDIIIIDPEFRDLIPPLSQDEQATLEQAILDSGEAIEPLVCWRAPNGSLILLDGHHRYDICTRWSLPYTVREMTFPGRDEAKLWMLRHQLGRRNITPAQRVELALLMEPLIEAQNQANQAKTRFGANPAVAQTSAPPCATQPKQRDERSTVGQVAKIAGVSRDTVRKVRKVKEQGDDETRRALHEGRVSVNKAYRETAKKKPESKPAPVDEVGQPLMTTHLMQAFGADRDMLNRLRNQVNSIEREAETLFDNGFDAFLPGGQRTAFKRDCNNIRKALKFMVPHAVCPICDGDDNAREQCKSCRGQGWVNKEVFDSIPKEAKGGK